MLTCWPFWSILTKLGILMLLQKSPGEKCKIFIKKYNLLRILATWPELVGVLVQFLDRLATLRILELCLLLEIRMCKLILYHNLLKKILKALGGCLGVKIFVDVLQHDKLKGECYNTVILMFHKGKPTHWRSVFLIKDK